VSAEAQYYNAQTLGDLKSEKPPKQAAKNRKCSGCGMTLSIYNLEKLCTICLPVRCHR